MPTRPLCGYLCVGGCPAEALSSTESRQASIGERRFEHSKLDMIRCMYGIYALVKGSGSFGGVEIPPGPGDIEHFWQAREQQNGRDRAMVENCFGIICGDYCGKCLHQCPAHLYWRAGARRRKPRK